LNGGSVQILVALLFGINIIVPMAMVCISQPDVIQEALYKAKHPPCMQACQKRLLLELALSIVLRIYIHALYMVVYIHALA